MNKLIQFFSELGVSFSSRRVWVIIGFFVISGLTGVRELVPVEWLPTINTALAILGVYFGTPTGKKSI